VVLSGGRRRLGAYPPPSPRLSASAPEPRGVRLHRSRQIVAEAGFELLVAGFEIRMRAVKLGQAGIGRRRTGAIPHCRDPGPMPLEHRLEGPRVERGPAPASLGEIRLDLRELLLQTRLLRVRKLRELSFAAIDVLSHLAAVALDQPAFVRFLLLRGEAFVELRVLHRPLSRLVTAFEVGDRAVDRPDEAAIALGFGREPRSLRLERREPIEPGRIEESRDLLQRETELAMQQDLL